MFVVEHYILKFISVCIVQQMYYALSLFPSPPRRPRIVLLHNNILLYKSIIVGSLRTQKILYV